MAGKLRPDLVTSLRRLNPELAWFLDALPVPVTVAADAVVVWVNGLEIAIAGTGSEAASHADTNATRGLI